MTIESLWRYAANRSLWIRLPNGICELRGPLNRMAEGNHRAQPPINGLIRGPPLWSRRSLRCPQRWPPSWPFPASCWPRKLRRRRRNLQCLCCIHQTCWFFGTCPIWKNHFLARNIWLNLSHRMSQQVLKLFQKWFKIGVKLIQNWNWSKMA